MVLGPSPWVGSERDESTSDDDRDRTLHRRPSSAPLDKRRVQRTYLSRRQPLTRYQYYSRLKSAPSLEFLVRALKLAST